jgi:drug/metabolite transporter (DMT)-like permease
MDPALIFKSAEFYFVLAAASWAAITLLSQRSHLHINPIHYSFFISLFSMLILFVLTVGYDISIVFEQDRRFWLSLLYLGIFGQSVATTIFFIASGRLGSAKASSFMFLVPLFAVVISFLVLDEKIQMHVIVGGLVSLVAVYFINKRSLS